MKKIELKYPVNNIKEITLRRPKVKDLLAAEKLDLPDAEKELLLIEMLSGVSKDILLELDVSDYSKLQKAYVDFLKG